VFALALAAFFGCGYLIRRYEDRLTTLAERALPGPLVAALEAKFDRGVLHIHLPKPAEVAKMQQKIEIKKA